MPFQVNVDHEQRLVSSVWEGEIDERVCIDYIEGVWGDPAVGEYDELVDFRPVTHMNLPTEAIQRLACRSRSVATVGAKARSVLVASEAMVYGLSRMYVSLRDMDDTHQREWQVLDDMDAARRWLRREEI